MCEKCPKREKCKTLCKKVKAHLRKCKIKTADWIRPRMYSKKRKDGLGPWREIPFSSLAPIDTDRDELLSDEE